MWLWMCTNTRRRYVHRILQWIYIYAVVYDAVVCVYGIRYRVCGQRLDKKCMQKMNITVALMLMADVLCRISYYFPHIWCSIFTVQNHVGMTDIHWFCRNDPRNGTDNFRK